MSGEPAQLALTFPHGTALGADDFIVGDANAAAVGFLERWPDWTTHAALLVGPEGSGKTHLAAIWAARAEAVVIPAPEASEARLLGKPGDRSRPRLVEDIDRGLADERALFHLLNLAREQRFHVLMTARMAPGHFDIALPDLRSRLRSFPVATLAPPDETLLQTLLLKLLDDRQIPATPHAITHLVRHMERSMGAALTLVAAIDRLTMARKAGVTRALARDALQLVGGGWGDGDAAAGESDEDGEAARRAGAGSNRAGA